MGNFLVRSVFQTNDQPGTFKCARAFKFKSALLIVTVSTNAFYSTNLFCCFSRYQAPTNSEAPSFCIQTTRNPQFLDSLRRRANARNVSLRISLRWPIYIINPVDKKLSCYTSHRRTITFFQKLTPPPSLLITASSATISSPGPLHFVGRAEKIEQRGV